MLTFKTHSTPNHPLHEESVDVWHINLANPAYLPFAENLLTSEELTRTTRYHFKKHRRRFSLARAAMRVILMRYTGLTQLKFSYNKYGKPYLSTHPLAFNLSHSKDLALLAIAKNPLGIDIEYFSERNYLGIAYTAFSRQEITHLELIQSQNPQLLSGAFFHIWAQKEAFIKAIGLGLSYPTRDFSVSALPPASLLSIKQAAYPDWQMQSFQANEDSWAALCYHKRVKSLNHFLFDWDSA